MPRARHDNRRFFYKLKFYVQQFISQPGMLTKEASLLVYLFLAITIDASMGIKQLLFLCVLCGKLCDYG